MAMDIWQWLAMDSDREAEGNVQCAGEQSDSRIQYQSSPVISDVHERCGMSRKESVQTTIPYTLRCDDHFTPHLGHLPRDYALIPPLE